MALSHARTSSVPHTATVAEVKPCSIIACHLRHWLIGIERLQVVFCHAFLRAYTHRQYISVFQHLGTQGVFLSYDLICCSICCSICCFILCNHSTLLDISNAVLQYGITIKAFTTDNHIFCCADFYRNAALESIEIMLMINIYKIILCRYKGSSALKHIAVDYLSICPDPLACLHRGVSCNF